MAVDLTVRLTNPPVSPEQLRLLYVREDGRMTDGKPGESFNAWEVLPTECSTETLTLKAPNVMLRGEGLHTIRVAIFDANTPAPNNWEVLGRVPVYSLNEDLFELNAYKGDFHAHSTESDGQGTSTSVYAYARRGGHDFMSLSDHRKLMPSVAAAKRVNALNSGMLAIPAEEFHYDGTPLHSVSINAERGICDRVKEQPELMKQRIADKKKSVPQGNLSPKDYESLVTAEAMYDLARELGSKLVIFAHPYWMPNDRYHAPTGYSRAMMERHAFDAVETPNGFGDSQFAMMTFADAMRLALDGQYETAFVNVTDTHIAPTEDFGANCTIVFAKELSIDAICDAVKARQCVATVGKRDDPNFKALHIGRDRLMRFAYFLTQNYFPEHDRLCREQGELMLKVLEEGDTSEATANRIAQLREELKNYAEKSWDK